MNAFLNSFRNRVLLEDPKDMGSVGMASVKRRQHVFQLAESDDDSSSRGVILQIRKGDMTKERVDAITNAANTHLHHISGLAGAILRAAGEDIQRESTALVRKQPQNRFEEGSVAVTNSWRLQETNGIKKVFHAVGPIFPFNVSGKNLKDVQMEEDVRLYQCVWNVLLEASSRGFESVSIPAISSGIFGFPKDRCARILFEAVEDFSRCCGADEGALNEGKVKRVVPPFAVYPEKQEESESPEKKTSSLDKQGILRKSESKKRRTLSPDPPLERPTSTSLKLVCFTNFDETTVEIFEQEFDTRGYKTVVDDKEVKKGEKAKENKADTKQKQILEQQNNIAKKDEDRKISEGPAQAKLMDEDVIEQEKDIQNRVKEES